MSDHNGRRPVPEALQRFARDPAFADQRRERAQKAAKASHVARIRPEVVEWAPTLKWQTLADVKTSLGELAELAARGGIDRRDGELIRKAAETWVRADMEERRSPAEVVPTFHVLDVSKPTTNGQEEPS